MATLEEIEAKLGVAKAYYIKQSAAELLIYKKGGCGNIKKLAPLKRLIRCLTYQINASVNDANTESLYECLLNAISGVTGNYVLDPTVQIPGQTTVVISQVVGYNINKYPFVTTDISPIAIFDNYHELYYPLYGNDPVLAMYVTTPDYAGDEQTSPIITFATPGDSSTDIVSIRYEYPIGTAGELQMSGKAPNSNGTGSGGSGNTPIPPLTYTQANLLNAGTVDEPNWYLPLSLPTGRIPYFVTVNGINDSSRYIDLNSNPIKVFGFANNDAQTIKVYIN